MISISAALKAGIILSLAVAVVALAIAFTASEYGKSQDVKVAALEANNTRLQQIVNNQKPLVWGEYNFETEYCNMRGHEDDLIRTEANTNLINGTVYATVVRCYLDEGKIVDYAFQNDAIVWTEVDNRDPVTKDDMSIDRDNQGST